MIAFLSWFVCVLRPVLPANLILKSEATFQYAIMTINVLET